MLYPYEPAPEPVEPEGALRPTGTTLDPADWTLHRQVAHRALDAMLDYQEGIRDQPAWRRVPDELEPEYRTSAPLEPQGIERAYEDFLRLVRPFPTGNAHPRFWGWVPGQGTPGGLIAALLAGGMNNVSGQFNDGASRVHDQVIAWLSSAMGFPADASGILTSGGSVANLVGLVVGRDARAPFDSVVAGLSASSALRIYGSVEAHSSIVKAAQLMGLGRDNVVLVPTNDRFEIDAAALAAAIDRDRRDGHHPAILVGNAGTVGTGATDDLDLLADIAVDGDLWFHIDGAFGAIAAWSDETRHLVKGMDRADSLAFDLHKWTSVPYDVGCVLVRDREAHHHSFATAASYLEVLDRGPAAVNDPTNGRGMQLSRGFRALKVWMSIKEHGMGRFGEVAAENVRQTAQFADLVRTDPELELLAPAPMCITCFRFAPAGVESRRLDDVNREVLMRLQEQGIAVPSSTRIDGRFALRVANTNHRTSMADLELLARETVRLGREVLAGH